MATRLPIFVGADDELQVIVSGTDTVDPAVLGTGTRDTTRFLRDDGTWAIPAGGGGTTVLAVAPAGPEQVDWAPAGFSSTGSFTIRMQPTGPVWISGLTAGSAGQQVRLYNDSNFVIALVNDAGSTAANRFSSPRKTQWILPREACDVQYCTTSSRWVIIDSTVDVLLVGPRMNLIVAVGAATPSVYNVAVTNTATVTNVAPNTTPTNDFNEAYALQATNATAAGTSGSIATSGLFARGATTGRGGVFMTGTFLCNANSATGASYAGLTSSIAVNTTLPNALTQCFLIGAQQAQTTLRVFGGNAAAGAPVDLGANFPVGATQPYEYMFHLPANNTVGYYMVRRLDTHFCAAGSYANTPTNTTTVGPRTAVMVGGTAATNTAQYGYMTVRQIGR